MTVFADTFVLIAWLNPRDNAHAIVTAYLECFTGRLLTTEWVLMELADALSAPTARSTAVAFLQAVRADPLFQVVGYNPAVYRAGFDLFAARPDKAWTLTDCISFGVMARAGSPPVGQAHLAGAVINVHDDAVGVCLILTPAVRVEGDAPLLDQDVAPIDRPLAGGPPPRLVTMPGFRKSFGLCCQRIPRFSLRIRPHTAPRINGRTYETLHYGNRSDPPTAPARSATRRKMRAPRREAWRLAPANLRQPQWPLQQSQTALAARPNSRFSDSHTASKSPPAARR